MNYSAGISQRVTRDRDETDQYSWLQLSPGVNAGTWRLRNITNWKQTRGKTGRWQVMTTYLEHGINGISSRLTLGERYTSSEIFDSVPFQGAMLASDDRMVPSSQYMYAPVIRGVARTQARIEVKQNGYTIYNQVVAPGPFALSNFNPSGAGGDFQVTVWEADGAPQVFTVPFQTPAVAIKEGYLRYSLMAGQYHSSDRRVTRAPVMEATAMYGLPYGFTLYGGIQAARHFQASSLGTGLSMGDWGALSSDVTLSCAQLAGHDPVHGYSWRMRYSKSFVGTNTSLSLVNLQFSQPDYFTLAETLDSWRDDGTAAGMRRKRRKSRTGLSVSQGLSKWGYLNAGVYQDIYWKSGLRESSINAGYSVPFRNMTLSVNWTANQGAYHHRNDHIVSLWLSVPLNKWVGGDTRASYRYTHSSSGPATHSAGLSGNAFDQRLSWRVDQRYTSGDATSRNNADVSLGWTGTYGHISGDYSYDRNYHQRSLGIDGGLIAHRHGLTFTQELGETNALIVARGASGVQVLGSPGIATDYRGYTALPYLNPYHENTLSVDPLSFPPDAEITLTDKKVVPTAGAVIPVKFKTNKGAKAIIKLIQTDRSNIPFGSIVHVSSPAGTEGIVDNNGTVFLSGLAREGRLIVKWKGKKKNCSYQLEKELPVSGLYSATAKCD
nr:fimbria/pilus outer membrane usher protein [Pantoea vagans]